VLPALLSLGNPCAAAPSPQEARAIKVAPDSSVPPPPPAGLDEAAVVARCVEILVQLQENLEAGAPQDAAPREWPYEGVYRESPGPSQRSAIPLGYRVGGTAIVGWALSSAPGYAQNAEARAAVERGLAFVLEQLGAEGMRPGFNATYDVRGWGHAYSLWFLLHLRARGLVPEAQKEAVGTWIESLVDTLESTEIRPGGGWNYARRSGFEGAENAASPFMTGPTLLALFEARRQGFAVDAAVVERALAALESTRIADGDDEFSYGYSAGDGRSGRPGAMGRITSSEVALFLAGRGSEARLTSGVQCFVEHWQQLEVRRRQNRTHIPPYGVAPYYVYFAHYHTALAVSLLPEEQRAELRVKYLGRLFQSRLESGGWNDRVFDRSENYGTAMGMLSLLAKDAPALAGWGS